MSQNFFAALDDSGDEAPPKAPSAKTTTAGVVGPASKGTNSNKAKSTTTGGGGPKGGGGGGSKMEPSQPAPFPRTNNDRNTKFGRGGRTARDGKRAYERHSGTGRGKEIKKGGDGARNWGSDKNYAKKMEGTINEEDVVNLNETEGGPTEAGEGGGGEVEVDATTVQEAEPEPEPVEDKTMTYAEYMASKGKKEESSGREVTNEFQGKAAAVKKEEEDFLVMGGGKQKKTKKKKEDEKKTVDVGFRVAASTNADFDGGRGGGRGERGGRSGGRDGRGRGRGRGEGRGRGREGRGGRGPRDGGYNKGPKLDVQDEKAFPSL